MRIALPFQRRSGSGERRRATLGVAVLGGALSIGCFFELAELEDPTGIGGAGGVGGVAPPPAGASGVMVGGNAGASGDTGNSPCPPDQKDCGQGCVPFTVDNGCGDPSCTPCAPLPQASLSCSGDTNTCQFASCNAGFADCDGDGSQYSGEPSGLNGCEYSFGPGNTLVSVAPSLIDVPRGTINITDQSRDDWAGIPAYPLLATCAENDCVDDALPPVVARNELPLRSDLDAYFRVAWDNDFFYVLGDVFDSSPVNTGDQTGNGICQNGSLCEDALTVFFDGRNNRSVSPGYSIDDSRVFVGLGGKAYRVSGFLEQGQVDLQPFQNGPYCYRIEARFAWTFIVGVQGNASELAGHFPPLPGQEYGFDVSVNDWDPGISDPKPQRDSQLFWVNPGPNYQRETSGFGPIRLSDGPVPAVNAPQ